MVAASNSKLFGNHLNSERETDLLEFDLKSCKFQNKFSRFFAETRFIVDFTHENTTVQLRSGFS